MIRNYFKIAWRNLSRNKGFSLINIIGLSIGVAACILISIYILHESSYDKHVSNSDNVYRLNNSFDDDGTLRWGIHFSANTAPTVLAEFEEVENSGRLMDNALFYGAGSNEIRFDGEEMQYHEEGFSYADHSMISIMDIQMVYGDANTALAAPNTIVISENIADKYFRGENPVGKIIYLNGNNEEPFSITAVMENFASNSHLDYDFLLTLTDVEFGEGEQTRWIQQNYFTYLVLKPGTNLAAFDDKISSILVGKYIKNALKDAGYAMWETVEEKGGIASQALTDINLRSGHIDFESNTRSDIKIIWIFGVVALFILIIASINFVNLSTAQSANRAKEVGLRKVVGSSRWHLLGQFLMESVLISILAFILGTALSMILMPFFQEMTGLALSIPFLEPMFLPTILVLAIIVGLLAGLYPALYLSGYNPIQVLKGKLRLGSKSGGLRSSLVVFQFTVSIILIVGTLIVNQQMNFILNSKIGFNKDQVIQLYGTNMLGEQVEVFKDEIQNISDVNSVSISDFIPLKEGKRNGNSFVNEGRDNIDDTVGGQAWVIDEDYLETLGMKLAQGRNFSEEIASDEQAVIINQEMAKRLVLDEPIGKRISRYGNLYEIIGVVEDFNFNSLKEKVEPMAMFYGISPSIISVKANSEDMSSLLANMESKWAEFAPNLAFRYKFMDDSFANMYENVSRLKAIFTTFAILAIFVACLGLFALSAYMIEQRSKEMSIRKVLGASFNTIFQLLTKNFLTLIIVSMGIAIPAAYYLMKFWLQDYEYRVDIAWPVFAVAGVLAIAIALTTVSFHAVKAALVNPVKNLKSE